MLRRPTLPLPLFRSLAVIFLWCVPVFLIFFFIGFLHYVIVFSSHALLLFLIAALCVCVVVCFFGMFFNCNFLCCLGSHACACESVRVRTLIVCPFPLLDNLHLICLLYARWFYIRLVLIAKNSSTRINRHTHTRTPATACPQHNCVCPPPHSLLLSSIFH